MFLKNSQELTIMFFGKDMVFKLKVCYY